MSCCTLFASVFRFDFTNLATERRSFEDNFDGDSLNTDVWEYRGSGPRRGGFNSESGVGGADASTIACKALYTRSTGAKGYVSFAFRKTVTPENDINDFAFFMNIFSLKKP